MTHHAHSVAAVSCLPRTGHRHTACASHLWILKRFEKLDAQDNGVAGRARRGGGAEDERFSAPNTLESHQRTPRGTVGLPGSKACFYRLIVHRNLQVTTFVGEKDIGNLMMESKMITQQQKKD